MAPHPLPTPPTLNLPSFPGKSSACTGRLRLLVAIIEAAITNFNLLLINLPTDRNTTYKREKSLRVLACKLLKYNSSVFFSSEKSSNLILRLYLVSSQDLVL
ncbi:hypothetical protein CIHG_04792 [Coccidioides immitis H538.4]|uniref:Uncharacterized protein n=1 Tax=Coccidioides immitis H538.4 TaxID=396776 RepID=A0A0J8RRW6_COCIT|nr:hypothetical protein CIHG_04792 [Coccidioides immitis H538.4]